MTAAHCVYDTTKKGNLLGIAQPSSIAVRVGSTNVSDVSLGVAAGVVAVLPQPYYRWDGSRHNHDVALLALDRTMPQQPAALAEQRPGAGKQLLIAGYGSTSTNDQSDPSALRGRLITAARPRAPSLGDVRSVLVSCSAAATDPAIPGGTPATAIRAGPAFAYENTVANLVVEGVISYGSRAGCEFSRSYLVLVSSAGSSIARSRHRRRTGPSCATIRRWRRSGRPGVTSARGAR